MDQIDNPTDGAGGPGDTDAFECRLDNPHDTAGALAFLRAWEPSGPWLLTAIKPDTSDVTTEMFHAGAELAVTRWIECHQGKRNLYFSVNRPLRDLRLKAKKEDIGAALALHVDADPQGNGDITAEREDILAKLRAHHPPPSVIINSGGGYAAYWLAREPVDVVGDFGPIEARNRLLEQRLSGDNCHNIDRIMRLPGTVNLPNAKKRARGRVTTVSSVVEADWDRRYDLLAFGEVPSAPDARPDAVSMRRNGHALGDLDGLTDELRELIVSGDPSRQENDRSKLVLTVACQLVRVGRDNDQIAAVLLDPTLGVSAHVRDQAKPQEYAQRQARRAREFVTNEPLVLSPNDPFATARAFVLRRPSRLLCHAGDIYEWRRSHYGKLDQDAVRAELYPFLEGARSQGRTGLVPFAPTRGKVDNVIDALKALVHLRSDLTPPCWIEGGGDGSAIMSCRNGLLRLSDGVLLPHSPAYFTTSAAEFDHDSRAKEPHEWLKFLATVWPHDQQSIDTSQEMYGYILSGDNRFQKMFLLIGPPRSGKGTIGRVLTKLLGGRGHAGLPLASLNGDFGLQPLLGKLLVTVPDARLQGRSHTIVERLLAISGGDDLTIARKNTTSVTTRLPARFVFLTNVLPSLADPSGTVASRFIVLMLNNSFLGKEDLDLEERFTQELPGILNWAMAGWQRLAERGRFVQPESGKENATNLTYLASPIKQFIEDRYEVGVNDEEDTAAVYEDWRDFWRESGQPGEPGNAIAFGTNLAAAFPMVKREDRRRRISGVSKKWYVYKGLRNLGRSIAQAELGDTDEDVPF